MNIQIPGFSSGDQARGLQNFITDIRNCPSREAEQQRIDKELANIRGKFAGSSSLTPYQVGLCVCLLYICALRGGVGRSVAWGSMDGGHASVTSPVPISVLACWLD